MKLREVIAVTGIVSGYAETVLQLSPGPGYVFSNLRDKINDHIRDLPAYPSARDFEDKREFRKAHRKSDWQHSWKELVTCGWCLAPWIALPIYTVLSITGTKRHKAVEYLAGGATATALSALVRHFADLY